MSSKKEADKIKSIILTIVQYATILALLMLSKWLSDNIYLKLTQALGGVIATWAIFEMNKGKLNISPTPRDNSVLIQSGPYKLIRHPMYSSLILTFTPMIISYYSLTNLIIFVVFIINLILKMYFEESLLKQHFTDYKQYMKKSWRLFPYIF